MKFSSDRFVIAMVQRAAEREAAQVALELRRGLGVLATIASTVAFVGLFATSIGMIGSFRGRSGDRWTCALATVEALTESVIPTALSLAVAIAASTALAYFAERLTLFDIEMKNGISELTDALIRFGRRDDTDVHYADQP